MSARPIKVKQANRLRKAMRRTLPVKFDLVQYLLDRRYAQTKGEARKIILAGRVKSESHVLGREQALVQKPLTLAQQASGRTSEVELDYVVQPYVDASVKPTLVVLPA